MYSSNTSVGYEILCGKGYCIINLFFINLSGIWTSEWKRFCGEKIFELWPLIFLSKDKFNIYHSFLKRKLIFCLLWEYGTVGESVGGGNTFNIQAGLEWQPEGNVRKTIWMLLKVTLKGTVLPRSSRNDILCILGLSLESPKKTVTAHDRLFSVK